MTHPITIAPSTLPSLPLAERHGLPDAAAISYGATESRCTTVVPLSMVLSR
jgi:hypothetical protein